MKTTKERDKICFIQSSIQTWHHCESGYPFTYRLHLAKPLSFYLNAD